MATITRPFTADVPDAPEFSYRKMHVAGIARVRTLLEVNAEGWHVLLGEEDLGYCYSDVKAIMRHMHVNHDGARLDWFGGNGLHFTNA